MWTDVGSWVKLNTFKETECGISKEKLEGSANAQDFMKVTLPKFKSQTNQLEMRECQ